jgi:PAS domain S-box-containing protein
MSFEDSGGRDGRGGRVGALPTDLLWTTFDRLPIAIGICDADGVFVAVNPQLAALLEADRRDIIGRPFLVFVHPQARSASLAMYFRSVVAAAEGRPRATEHAEIPCVTAKGSLLWASVTWIVTDSDATGDQYGIVYLSGITRRG